MFKKIKLSKINNNYKKQNKPVKSIFRFITFLLWFFSSVIIIFIWFFIVSQISIKSTNILNNNWFLSWSYINWSLNNQSLKKTWKVNILVIWRWWDENDAPDLTDTIILASINYDLKSVSMLSIPRDMYIKYSSWWWSKINEAYSRFLKNTKDKTLAIEKLKETITNITWENIDYFVNIDFEWFRKIIDTIWWIEIDVPEDIYDNTFPWPHHTYTTFKIIKWLQKMNWETALKYARSRHSTSDFDRSLRQQLIIKAIKDKVMSLWILANPIKIKSLYDVVSENILTDLSFQEIVALALFWKDVDRDNIYTSNLNNTCVLTTICEKWWFLYNPPREDFGWASVLIQEWWIYWKMDNFDNIKKYSSIIFNHPFISKENMEISIFNSTKVWGLAEKYSNELIRYWFIFPKSKYIWNTSWDKYEKSKILYYSTWTTIPETVKVLEKFILWWSEKLEFEHKYSKNPNNKIEIIIWDDYKTIDL